MQRSTGATQNLSWRLLSITMTQMQSRWVCKGTASAMSAYETYSYLLAWSALAPPAFMINWLCHADRPDEAIRAHSCSQHHAAPAARWLAVWVASAVPYKDYSGDPSPRCVCERARVIGGKLWMVRGGLVGCTLVCPTKHSLAIFVGATARLVGMHESCHHRLCLLAWCPLWCSSFGVADISSATASQWLGHAFGPHAYTNEVAVQVMKHAVVAAIEDALAAAAARR